jgi:hypothetical protein
MGWHIKKFSWKTYRKVLAVNTELIKDNTKMDLREINCENVNWIYYFFFYLTSNFIRNDSSGYDDC